MRILFTLLPLFLFFSSVTALDWTGNVNLLLSQKSLDDDDWGELDSQFEFGVLFDFGKKSWGFSIVTDILASADSATEFGIDIDGSTTEYNFGLRKYWPIGKSIFRPYIGGGLGIVSAKLEFSDGTDTVTDDDTAFGIWVNGGIKIIIAKHFNLGIDLRYSKAEVNLYDIDGEAGGFHSGIALGYHW